MAPPLVKFILNSDSRISYHHTGKNLNYGKANNIGIKKAIEGRFDFIAIINPDTWFSPNWMHPIINFLMHNPNYGCLSPLQLNYEGNDLANWTQKQLISSSVKPDDIKRIEVLERPFLEGSCLILPTNVLEKIGGFDPIYEMYYEEMDLCRRLKKSGYRLGIYCKSTYHHYSSENTPSAERALKIDLSQFIYILTNPNASFVKNLQAVSYWLLRKGKQWIRGQKPTFPKLLKTVLFFAIKKNRCLYVKWQQDSQLPNI